MQNVNLLNMTTAEKLVALAKAVNDIYNTPIFPNPRGEWVSNESYNKYDIVVYNHKTYWSIYDGAQSGQQPDTSPNYWVLYIDPINGKDGTNGTDGIDGKAATITVGTTETVAPDESAEVTNVGNENVAVLNFKIPMGASAQSYVHQINFKTSGITGQSVGFDGCIFIFNEEPNPYTDLASIGKELLRQGFNGVTTFCNCYGIVSDRSDGSSVVLRNAASAGGFDTGIFINCIEPSRQVVQLDSSVAHASQTIKDTVSKSGLKVESDFTLKVYCHGVSFRRTDENYAYKINAMFYTFNEYPSPMTYDEFVTYIDRFGSSGTIIVSGVQKSNSTTNITSWNFPTVLTAVSGGIIAQAMGGDGEDSTIALTKALYEGDSVTQVL